jgi:hypothetical protein
MGIVTTQSYRTIKFQGNRPRSPSQVTLLSAFTVRLEPLIDALRVWG